MTRRARNALIALVGTVCALYAVALGYIAVNETRLVFPGARPRELARSVPVGDVGFPWDTLRINAPDGAPVFLLSTRFADSVARPWALYFHGNAGHIASRGNLDRYRLLREAGFNVLAAEFRGFGASASVGAPSSAVLATDALAAWEYLTKTLGVAANRIVVYGWSLGGGVASQLATTVQPAAIITEGAFTSLSQMGAQRYPWLPVSLVARNKFDNITAARTLTVPWLVFHGRSDDVVPFAHGEALAAAAKSGRFVPLNADHEDGVARDREVALGELRAIAQRLLPTSSGAAAR